MNQIVPLHRIERAIFLIRGQRVMLAFDLADLYGVTTGRLNEQVKRNRARFPEDFMFQLTPEEFLELVAICDKSRRLRHAPAMPYAFTEHGAIMLASVLNSPRAVEASLLVVRTFVKLRETLATHRELARKMEELERRLEGHDGHIRTLVDAIRQLMEGSETTPRRIGFRPEGRKSPKG